jgi:flagellar biosynthesis protein FliQ
MQNLDRLQNTLHKLPEETVAKVVVASGMLLFSGLVIGLIIGLISGLG